MCAETACGPLAAAVRALAAGAIVVVLAAIARVDARRLEISPPLIAALLAAAATWRLAGGEGGATGSWFHALLGAALGAGIVMAPIAFAQALRRPWPLFPGDAMLLGGMGFLLGPVALSWALIVGCAASVVYRVCLQRRRGRPLWRGYVPLAPGMSVGAAAVLLALETGFATGDLR